jgi:2-hydroxychromene-2-carboxylate isomerase
LAQPIDFYFDFSSPYGYIASERIESLAERHGRSVNWRPMLLGAVFKIVGTEPLLNYPLKGDYARRDMARAARQYGLTFQIPDNFPTASIAACRAFYWLLDRDAARAKSFALAIYRRYFVEGKPIALPDDVIATAAAQGIDSDALVAALQDGTVKQRLKKEVEEAIARGVFGSPFLFVDGEPFWGSDRLDQIERWLETGGW